jgi:hypothetical protein
MTEESVGSPHQENKISEETLQALTGQIEQEVILPGHFIWGHGAPLSEGEKILLEGIKGNPAYGLTEMSIPLQEKDLSDHENAASIVKKAMHWPHRNRKGIILISIPEDFKIHQVVEEVVVDNTLRARVPTRFLSGFIDAEKGIFVKNPQFEEEAKPTTESLTRFPQGIGNRGSADRQVPTMAKKDPDKDTPDVW